MNGHVIPGTPIAVDFWKVRDHPHAKVFFLTHLHGDHVVGLTSSWRRRIYCSEFSANLLVRKYSVRQDLIQVLHTDTNYLVPLDDNRGEQMTVTMFDANHCPGSAMFLFEGYFGKILYTGDFRFHQDMIRTLSPKCVDSVDVLYLDNTYCTPKSSFPSRKKTLEQIIDIIRKHPNHHVVIGVRSLGKENMLVNIAIELDEYVSVPANLLRNATILNLPEVFTTPETWSRIRVMPFNFVSRKNVAKWNTETPTVVILPTALYCGIGSSPFANYENTHIVPYSDHSSYEELLKFVALIKPKSVIPIVAANARGPFGMSVEDRADMTCFRGMLSTGKQRPLIIPASVKQFMNTSTPFIESVSSKRLTTSRKRKQPKKPNKNKVKGVEFTDSWSPPSKLRSKLVGTDGATSHSLSHEHNTPGVRSKIEVSTFVNEKRDSSEVCRKNGNRVSDLNKEDHLRICSDDQVKSSYQTEAKCTTQFPGVLTLSSSLNALVENYPEKNANKEFVCAKAQLVTAELVESRATRDKRGNELVVSHSLQTGSKSKQTSDRNIVHTTTMSVQNICVIPLPQRHKRREAGCRALFDKYIHK